MKWLVHCEGDMSIRVAACVHTHYAVTHTGRAGLWWVLHGGGAGLVHRRTVLGYRVPVPCTGCMAGTSCQEAHLQGSNQ